MSKHGKSRYSVSGGTGNERGREVVSYTVASDFDTGDSHEVTLILLNRATNNGFYEKHVLRLSDDSEEVLDLRQNIASVPVEKLGEAIDRFAKVTGNNVSIVQAPKSTMLRLDRIDQKLAVFLIAKGFVEAMYDDAFGDLKKGTVPSANHEVKITFPAQCVEQRERDGTSEMGNTMSIGGRRMSISIAGVVKSSFDINHCGGT